MIIHFAAVFFFSDLTGARNRMYANLTLVIKNLCSIDFFEVSRILTGVR